ALPISRAALVPGRARGRADALANRAPGRAGARRAGGDASGQGGGRDGRAPGRAMHRLTLAMRLVFETPVHTTGSRWALHVDHPIARAGEVPILPATSLK